MCFYCCFFFIQDGEGAGDADDVPFDDENEEHFIAQQQNFLGENLVDAPQMVTTYYYNNALKIIL